MHREGTLERGRDRHKSAAGDIVGRLVAEVGVVELGIVTAALHQDIVCSLFHD